MLFYIHPSPFMQLMPSGYLTPLSLPLYHKPALKRITHHANGHFAGAFFRVWLPISCLRSSTGTLQHLKLSLPPISILNKLSFAIPIVPFTHYALSSFHILNIWNALIFFGGLTNDHLSLNRWSSVITCSRKTLLVTWWLYKLNYVYLSTLLILILYLPQYIYFWIQFLC